MIPLGLVDDFDRSIATALSLRTGQSDTGLIAAMQAISWASGGSPRWVIVIAICATLLWQGWRRPAIALAVASLGSLLASESLKALFGRVRPDIVVHLDSASNAAYPSGHATNTAVVYVLLALFVSPRWRTMAMGAAMLLAALTGLSRIMLGVHWPTDVIGGWMLGTAFAFIAAWWARRATGQPSGGR